MRFRHLIYLYAFILGLCVTHAVRGEHDASSTPSAETGSRPSADATLTDEMLSVLKLFNPSESYLKGKFGTTLPSALETTVKQGNEDDIAKILAELSGQINSTQLKAIEEAVREGAEREGVECGKENDNARRLGVLQRRVLWAALILQGKDIFGGARPKCVTPFDKFKQAFDREFAAIREANAEFYKKLEQALAGNNEAKEFLKRNYDERAVLSFLEAQGKTGNEKLANDLAQALSERDEKGHFIDVVGSGNDTPRIRLGDDPKTFNNVVQEFSSNPDFGSLANFSLAPRPHARPSREFTSSGRPEAPPAPQPRGDAGTPPTPPPAQQEPPRDVIPPPRPAPEPPAADTAALETQATTILTKNCATCHGPGKDDFETFPMTANGLPADEKGAPLDRNGQPFRDALARIEARGAPATGNASMPPRRERQRPSDAEKAILRQWLTAIRR